MNTFKSSLEAVRTLRECEEQDALHEYGRSLQDQEQARNRLESVQQELMGCLLELHRALETGGSAEELIKIQSYCQSVDRRRRSCEHALNVARNHARCTFIGLLAARQAKTIVDKLIAAQKRRYEQKRRKHEQKELDELASRRNTLFTLLHLSREPLWN